MCRGKNTGFKRCVEGKFVVVIDIVVLFNLVFLGIEVESSGNSENTDDDAMFSLVRRIVVAIYLIEMLLRFLTVSCKRGAVFYFLFDFTITIMAAIDAFVNGEAGWMWRMTLLRIHRFSRVCGAAKNFAPLQDLWLVLGGIQRSIPALIWLTIILSIVLFVSGSICMGLVGTNSGSLDVDEYFGSLFHASLTMFQVVTLDSWATKIVRPIMAVNPFAAFVIVCFVLSTTYGLLSIAVGVLVWSTVELAHTHADHGSQKQATQDKEIIDTLCEYFEAMIHVDEKDGIELRDLQDVALIPHVQQAFQALNLPIKDMDELFRHLDRINCGEISIEQLKKGLKGLKEPATPFDLACLTASCGSCVVMTNRLEHRSAMLERDVARLKTKLTRAFTGLAMRANDNDAITEVPEVQLRKIRAIRPGPPPKRERYTEGKSVWKE